MFTLIRRMVWFGVVLAVLVVGFLPRHAGADSSVLSVAVTGRNITRGQSDEYATVNARGGDTLDIIVRVRSLSPVLLSNVSVTDYLPIGLVYIPRSTTVNRSVVADGVTSLGLNIGSLSLGQEAVIKVSVWVDGSSVPSIGYATSSNTVQVRADGTGVTSARLPLILGAVSRVVSAAGVPTGPLDALLLAFAVAILTTGIYAGYTQTSRFRHRMATREIRALTDQPLDFNR